MAEHIATTEEERKAERAAVTGEEFMVELVVPAPEMVLVDHVLMV